jgi:hypothetical protein
VLDLISRETESFIGLLADSTTDTGVAVIYARCGVNTGTHAVFTAKYGRSVHLGSAARFGQTTYCGNWLRKKTADENLDLGGRDPRCLCGFAAQTCSPGRSRPNCFSDAPGVSSTCRKGERETKKSAVYDTERKLIACSLDG